MVFVDCRIAGAWTIDPSRHVDERGYFARAWCYDEFKAHGIEFVPVQANMALSLLRGTIRGLHYQVAPALEAKLVRCTRGAIFDVIVDVRRGSPTFRSWFGVQLSAENGRMLYLPEGCAHGCQSLEDNTEIHYMASSVFAPGHTRGARFDEPAFAIDWPLPATVVSHQDKSWPAFAEIDERS